MRVLIVTSAFISGSNEDTGRKRKLRCDWPDGVEPGHEPCINCKAHKRPCFPQEGRTRLPKVRRTTAQNRISNLEQELASLAAVVHNKQQSPSRSVPPNGGIGREANEEEFGHLLDTADVDGARSPVHLRSLFETLGSNTEYGTPDVGSKQSNPLPEEYIHSIRKSLQALLPPKADVVRLGDYASQWMSMYYGLFPAMSTLGANDQLFWQHDRMLLADVPLMTLAAYLLSMVVTLLQVPSAEDSIFSGDRKACQRFVADATSVIERKIVANNALAGSIEGLEVVMLFVRLQMGRGNLKNMWLTLRRAIALAEMIGLPYSTPSGSSDETRNEDQNVQAELWDAICATDRNASMMFNLPAATASYPFPRQRAFTDDFGKVSPKAYNYRLASVCAKIQQIDELYTRRSWEPQSYTKVMDADAELRDLRDQVPRSWWEQPITQPLADQCVQFWHHYILARVHLRPSLQSGDNDHFQFSHSVCSKACRRAIERFLGLRPLLPSGFFVCRVMDVQAFTAAIFLLLSNRMPRHTPHNAENQSSPASDDEQLLQRLVDTFAEIRDKPGADLAREALVALNTLRDIFSQSSASRVQPSTLQIPLLGKIHISHQLPTRRDSLPDGKVAPQDGQGTQDAVGGFDHQVDDLPADLASWLFEVDTNQPWFGGSISIDDLANWDFNTM